MQTIVSYPNRGQGGSSLWRGNCSPLLIKDLIQQYKVNEIADYMAGSFTTQDVAQELQVQSYCYDLHSGFDMLNHDIKERNEFIFWHPPYYDIIKYSDNMYSSKEIVKKYNFNPVLSDLSRCATWKDFLDKLNYCCIKQYTSLETGGRLAILMGDIKKNKKLYSMLLDIVKPGTIEQIIIKEQWNCKSYQKKYNGVFIPIVHEYLLILRKDVPLSFEINISKKIRRDIRNLQNATWKDIVADSLEYFNKKAELSQLYEIIEPYEKAKKNKYWKEKIRQTLQIYDIFISYGKGVWGIKK